MYLDTDILFDVVNYRYVITLRLLGVFVAFLMAVMVMVIVIEGACNRVIVIWWNLDVYMNKMERHGVPRLACLF